MDLEELDQRIDRLSIRKQLDLLLQSLTEAKHKLEISNLLWHRVLAAEELLTADESKVFDNAADALIHLRDTVGVRSRGRRRRRK
jgi:hypothetical protein